MGATVWYSAEHYSPSPETMEWRGRGLPHFFGVAVYALEGINLTLPVSASMRSIRKPPLVMTIGVVGFATVVAFYSGCVRFDCFDLAGCSCCTPNHSPPIPNTQPPTPTGMPTPRGSAPDVI